MFAPRPKDAICLNPGFITSSYLPSFTEREREQWAVYYTSPQSFISFNNFGDIREF